MSSRIASASRITRPFLSLILSNTCSPSSCLRHYPERGYYGNSVAMSLAAVRRSRLYDCETVVRLGLPFVSFNSFLESRSLGRALRMHDLHTLFPCHRFRYATIGALLTTGNEDSISLDLTSIPFGTSCAQDLRYLALHTFVLNRFPCMLLSPLSFLSR